MCSQAVLDFLSTADVGRLLLAEEDAVSEVSKWGLREYKEQEEECGDDRWMLRNWVLRKNLCSPHALVHVVRRRRVGDGLSVFFVLSFPLSFSHSHGHSF